MYSGNYFIFISTAYIIKYPFFCLLGQPFVSLIRMTSSPNYSGLAGVYSIEKNS
jgi:hypothetical protein